MLVLAAPYLPIFTLLTLRCVNKKLRNVFSRNLLRQAIGLRPVELPVVPFATYDTCFLFFLNLWDLERMKKDIHATPWKKAIRGVVQGAVRYVEYTGSVSSGTLRVHCMPSVKWGEAKSSENPCASRSGQAVCSRVQLCSRRACASQVSVSSGVRLACFHCVSQCFCSARLSGAGIRPLLLLHYTGYATGNTQW